MKKEARNLLTLLIVLLLFSMVSSANYNFSCFDKHKEYFRTHNNALLVEFEVINDNGLSEYSYIGGFFSYKIYVKNVGASKINDTVYVTVYNPTGEFADGKDIYHIDLNYGEECVLYPKFPGRKSEHKIFEFNWPGTYKITFSSKTDVNFFRCVGKSFIHYNNSIQHSFDPMPSWQKEALVVEKSILNTLSEINFSIRLFNKDNLYNAIFGLFSVLVALVGIFSRNRAIVKKGTILFLIAFSLIVIFAFSPLLLFTGVLLLPASTLISFFFIASALIFLYLYIPNLIRLIFYFRRIRYFEKKFTDNKYCVNCHRKYYSQNPKRNFRCPFCNSEKVINLSELDKGWKPLRQILKEKLFSKKHRKVD